MHAVLRTYSGQDAVALMDLLERNKTAVEQTLRGVDGFVSYALVRTADGGFSLSVYRDKAGADASVRVARDWTARNATHLKAAPPTVAEGTVILKLG